VNAEKNTKTNHNMQKLTTYKILLTILTKITDTCILSYTFDDEPYIIQSILQLIKRGLKYK